MAKYVLVYKGGNAPQSEEEGAAVMQAWMTWFGGLGQAVVDVGNPFGPSMAVATDGTASDGATSGLTGYSILSADSLSAATELAKNCPQLASGGSIEVYETFDVM
jgi:hypothetical protein